VLRPPRPDRQAGGLKGRRSGDRRKGDHHPPYIKALNVLPFLVTTPPQLPFGHPAATSFVCLIFVDPCKSRLALYRRYVGVCVWVCAYPAPSVCPCVSAHPSRSLLLLCVCVCVFLPSGFVLTFC